ncbi:ABC transporter permease [Paraliobacillus sp. JSM ZJ581]|uniref:ABC transporter permease n=1 Tax=Paraliobacillus sp. JSM ZJ581 TaxID=3342118 RepID=UPI0035A8734B
MLIQLKFALEDIWRKKLYFISFFIQIMLIILLITECFALIHKNQDAHDHISNAFDISNAFYISMAEKEDFAGGEYEENIMKDLYAYMNKNDEYISFATIEDYIEIKDMPKNSLSVEMEQGSSKIWAYKTLSISSGFINVFDLSLSKGEFFDASWEYVSNKSIPVVLGSSYEKYMAIHDEFTDGGNQKYKVVGFLQDGQTFVDISSGEGVVGLNDVILTPIDVTTFDNLLTDGNYSYETYLENSTIIFKDRNDIKELRDIVGNSKTYIYNFNSVEGVSGYMENSTQEDVGVFLFISILVIIFASSLVIINTFEFIRKNLREFSIHIFCGATKKHIALRIFLQIFIVWFLSFIISLIISNQTFIVLGVSGLILLLCLGTCLPSFITLFKLQISDILRSKE